MIFEEPALPLPPTRIAPLIKANDARTFRLRDRAALKTPKVRGGGKTRASGDIALRRDRKEWNRFVSFIHIISKREIWSPASIEWITHTRSGPRIWRAARKAQREPLASHVLLPLQPPTVAVNIDVRQLGFPPARGSAPRHLSSALGYAPPCCLALSLDATRIGVVCRHGRADGIAA
jgi:hypothetical protein